MTMKLTDAPRDRPVVILYVRLSSEEQAQGHGQERQVEGLRAWCRAEGVVADVILQDIGFSAYVGAHIRKGQLGQLIAAIEADRIFPGSMLVMENLDRLSRQDPFDALAVFTTILSKGITIATVSDRMRYSREGSGIQRMMTIIAGTMTFGRSNNESEVKSERVSKAWQKKIALARATGAPHGKRCPAWIYLKDGAYDLNTDRAEVVRWIFAQAIAGRGRRQIAEELNEREPPWTKPSKGNPTPAWTDSYIQKILTGCEAYGEYRPSIAPKGSRKIWLEPIPDYYPAAVDRATAMQARAAAALRQGSGGRKGAFKNLLQGICVCSYCGKGMTLEDKGRRTSGPKMVCQRAIVRACKHRFRYDYARLQAGVIFVVDGEAETLLRSSQAKVSELADRLSERRGALSDIVARLDRLGRQMQEIDDDTGVLTSQFRDLGERRRAVVDEIADLERQAAGRRHVAEEGALSALVAFYRRLEEIPEAEAPAARNEVNQRLRAIVSRIVFRDGTATVELATGERGFIEIPSRIPPRENGGQFSSRKDFAGKQLRRRGHADQEG
ncbi:recombinase family protein [Bosea sp. TND4EK4]|uniref:recombinase family protein n=1 Tax=Bosea sp. TND4EK4 TaxID=1907408 RepID=UPI000954F18C|nr:recombinase family protein [Bosea sp. TND4EK4]SIR28154.1 Site-specific DNA recombinase [Bosea sp. TND4EK4]